MYRILEFKLHKEFHLKKDQTFIQGRTKVQPLCRSVRLTLFKGLLKAIRQSSM